MKKITLESILNSLQNMEYEIHVPEHVKAKAKKAWIECLKSVEIGVEKGLQNILLFVLLLEMIFIILSTMDNAFTIVNVFSNLTCKQNGKVYYTFGQPKLSELYHPHIFVNYE